MLEDARRALREQSADAPGQELLRLSNAVETAWQNVRWQRGAIEEHVREHGPCAEDFDRVRRIQNIIDALVIRRTHLLEQEQTLTAVANRKDQH